MTRELTVGELWRWLTAEDLAESVLDWAPDVAALTTVLLERSHAFRFVVSPPAGAAWPPPELVPLTTTVTRAATEWRAAMDDGGGAPAPVTRLWATVLEHLDTPVADVAEGKPWPLCEAVLLLHAIADEAAAGFGGSATGTAAGAVHLAQAHELLVRTGTMTRLPVDRVAQLPKTRTTPVGMTHRSLSRYSCTTTDAVPAVWHRIPLRRLGHGPTARHANVLLLPWPLSLPSVDFRPVEGSIRRPEREPFGFFRYTPSERVDLDLVDAVLNAALAEVDRVDVVILPEGCLEEQDVDGLESVLARRGVSLLVSGLRIDPAEPGQLPSNGVHIGALLGDRWWHYRQRKHHRWFLDGGQIEQYNLAGALHPSVRWWEEMEIPQRAVHVLELGGGITCTAVVCEDLARLDGVAELLREVGPTLVVTLLLDGPQLASRWTARYAGVLADDPGSAVLTLTAYGMATRSRPRGRPPSGVIAMWKDPTRGVREISLDSGSHGVLLTAVHGRAPRYAADGRAPADDATDLFVAGVHQLRGGASPGGRGGPGAVSDPPAGDDALDTAELGVLWSWAEAVARASRSDGQTAADGSGEAGARVGRVLTEAQAGAAWRSTLRLPEPSSRLAAALGTLDRITRDALAQAQVVAPGALLGAVESQAPEPAHPERLVRHLLRTAFDTAQLQ